MSLSLSCWILAVVSLAPLALYIAGRIRDPFNPTIAAGGLTFAVVCWKPLHNPAACLVYGTRPSLAELQLISAISLLAFYAGWLYWPWRHRHDPLRWGQGRYESVRYDPARMFWLGAAFSVLSILIYVVTYHQYKVTGYIRDLGALHFIGAVLIIQGWLLGGVSLIPAMLWLLVAMSESIAQFFTYGQRGDTARLASLILVPFLFWGKRPGRIPILAGAAMLGIVMGSLAATRAIIGKGEATGRIQAEVIAARRLLYGHAPYRYGAGSTVEIGAAEISTVQNKGNWDYCRALWNIAVVFLPRQIFPNKYDYTTPWGPTNFLNTLRLATGNPIPAGAAGPGFAEMFVECWWLFPIPWFLVGYWTRSLHTHAVLQRRLDYQGYLALLFMVLLYGIAQGVSAGIFTAIFVLLPAWLSYKICRLPTTPSRQQSMRAAGTGGPA